MIDGAQAPELEIVRARLKRERKAFRKARAELKASKHSMLEEEGFNLAWKEIFADIWRDWHQAYCDAAKRQAAERAALAAEVPE